MDNGYGKFFKTARATAPTPAQKLSIKKLQSNSGEEIKGAINKRKKRLADEAKSRSSKRFPVSAGIALAASLAAGLFLTYDPSFLESALEKVEIGVFGAAEANSPSEKKEEKSSETKAEKAEKPATPTAEGAAPSKPVSSQLTPEEMALFSGLQERSKSLDQREAELKRMEEELQKQREALEKRMGELESVRKSIATQLEEKVKVDQERVDQLVQFYASMKAQQAARIIETLNEDLAVEVLLKMKKKNAAEIMNLIDAQKAQRLSEKFTGYRRK